MPGKTSRIPGPDGLTPHTSGTLIQRSIKLTELFDAETKDYAFGDSGDAESYAAEMADLLDQWVVASMMEGQP